MQRWEEVGYISVTITSALLLEVNAAGLRALCF